MIIETFEVHVYLIRVCELPKLTDTLYGLKSFHVDIETRKLLVKIKWIYHMSNEDV